MLHMKKIFLNLSIIFLAIGASAQTRYHIFGQNVLLDKDQKPFYILLKDQYRVEQSQAAAFLESMLFQEDGSKLSVLKSENDQFGFTHVRYSVIKNNVRVEEMTVVAHYREGRLYSVNGELYQLPAGRESFVISEKVALSAALKKVNAVKYKWENEEETAHMRQVFNDPDFTYAPTGEKVLMLRNGRTISAWKFNIYAEEPLYRANIFVDATNGRVIEEQNLICTVNTPGTAVTKYSGTQTIVCNQNTNTNVYTLQETTRGLGVETYNLFNTTNYVNNNFTNTASSWTLPANDQGALDAHWGAEKTWDYYMNIHNRNSINNNGYKLVSYVHYSTNYVNAFWDGTRMTYGDGNGGSYKIFTALDVCGHEITHGLTSNTGNLAYSNESGALNESFSDIFGTCIENFARPSNWNWKIGEDVTNGGGGLRTMANPNQFGDPDTYGGTNWYVGTADNGGVHTNSGVGNFWFYLLTMGGAGTNDIAQTYSVSGLGFNSASRIAFRALTVYFTPTTNYATARSLCIQSAKDLFGDCSNEMIQTMNAWHAVGVGNKYIPGQASPNFKADFQTYCNIPVNVNFTNLTAYAQSYVWDFGDGSTATFTNGVHTYSVNGTFNVKLKATACNATDSIIKQAYIVINVPPSPLAGTVIACGNAPVTLTATGANVLKWFDAPNGNALGTGSTVTAGAVSGPTTYYVANTIPNSPVTGGKSTNLSDGGYLANSNQWLNFTAVSNGTLNSVVVYASSAGARTIELRNSANTVIYSQPWTLSIGANTLTVAFPLTVGTNYRLALAAGTANLYRSTSSVYYPYNIGNVVSITGSSAGNASYYWFYNWEVVKEDCSSALVPVAIATAPAPSASLNAVPSVVCKEDAINLGGVPAGGVFSGSGVNGNVFNGTALPVGSKTITYTYTDANGCQGVDSKVLQTQECTGLEKLAAADFYYYPNPAHDNVHFENAGSREITVIVKDALGRQVTAAYHGSSSFYMDLSQLAAGVYMIEVYDQQDQRSISSKLVKQ